MDPRIRPTKGERREKRRRNRTKMVMRGLSVRLLQDLIVKRALLQTLREGR